MFDERLAADKDGRSLGYASGDAVLKVPFHERGQTLIVESSYHRRWIDSVFTRERGELVVEITGPRLLNTGHDVPPVRETELRLQLGEIASGDRGLPRPGMLRQREIAVYESHARRIARQNLLVQH